MIAQRDVSATLEVFVAEPCDIEMRIAVARVPGIAYRERLGVVVAGAPVTPEEIIDATGTRIHRFRAAQGVVSIDYRAQVTQSAPPVRASALDSSMYLRPSRYAESDTFFGFVSSRFDAERPHRELLDQVVEFVRSHTRYIPGTSDPIDSAADTLMAGAGVCRDYAHLTVALLRALNIPARAVAVYAPGCTPMDFHAVTEAIIDGDWVVVDATGLAPRAGFVRIATGRDAADIAFLENHGGSITLNSYWVSASSPDPLPVDDGWSRAVIA
ncbi:transglutaminase [Gordonia pseudamarae]|jgi:transglutaminase-like putative cysteine protease|uniref:Transglutaminase n=1 Tax=Gordonia pseudamarae TaxID=2831662 RepID=A0ABX6ID55_9ACTN|nr:MULTISPECIES: transglutaminase family protein [Gordonia]MBD0022043.1 transglutaminase family protein [Gordonia sp. (in: high G+C Gram-positive bacteria)]QHN24900.1 transglutaminase [Gordonia pseudamarae]QHN33833.1 transglutaminase [Gordonia pseudamarae]